MNAWGCDDYLLRMQEGAEHPAAALAPAQSAPRDARSSSCELLDSVPAAAGAAGTG